MKLFLSLLFLFIASCPIIWAQQTPNYQEELILIAGDSIPTYGIPLKEVILFCLKLAFKFSLCQD